METLLELQKEIVLRLDFPEKAEMTARSLSEMIAFFSRAVPCALFGESNSAPTFGLTRRGSNVRYLFLVATSNASLSRSFFVDFWAVFRVFHGFSFTFQCSQASVKIL